ncbi:MAG: AraC family transcriptional regulator [Bacteroidota bacterium]
MLTKERRQLSDNILAIWLTLMAIFMGLTVLKNEMPDGPFGKLQMFPFFFTVGPFLFLYVRTLAAAKPRLDFMDSLHVLPFVIFSVSAVTADSLVDEDILVGNSFQLNRLVYSVSALISIGVYLALTQLLLKQHRKNLLDHFSYTSRRISLNWLRAVVALFTVTIAVTVISALLNVVTGEQTNNPGFFLFLGFTCFAFAVTFFGIRQPAIFQRGSRDERFVDSIQEYAEAERNKTEAAEAEEIDEAPGKYARSSLTASDAARYRERLDAYMESEKPWLRRDLTIQDVSAELGIQQHHLTQTINEGLGKNFYTLVNEYRVNEVKDRLLDPQYAHLTVLAIAHDAGFNSKSSFNMTFKKYVGMTPSAYRRANR